VSESVVSSERQGGERFLQLDGTLGVLLSIQEVPDIWAQEEKKIAKNDPAVAGVQVLTKLQEERPSLLRDCLNFDRPRKNGFRLALRISDKQLSAGLVQALHRLGAPVKSKDNPGKSLLEIDD
jgi:hypothetical protein